MNWAQEMFGFEFPGMFGGSSQPQANVANAPDFELYEALGLDRANAASITEDNIRRAYYKVAQKYHPDKMQGDADPAKIEAFRKAAAAYEILSDKEKRAEYDASNVAAPTAAGPVPGFGGAPWAAGGF